MNLLELAYLCLSLEFEGNRFIVERMNKRHVSLVRITLGPGAAG